MVFNSISYLFYFPIVVIIYFIIPKKAKTLWLLIASYYFYMNWNIKYSLLLLFSTFTTYICGLLVSKFGERKQTKYQKLSMFGCIFINLLILFIFKYFNFTTLFISKVFNLININLNFPTLDFLLPVGISFYTFQALGYIIDVYRKDIKCEKNFITYALFVSFFPQLVAGPIEKAKNLLPQLKRTYEFKYDNAVKGFRMILFGMFKKVVIADTVAIYVDAVFNNVSQYTGLTLIVAVLLFSIQIYCDFSGYSEIAIGSAKVLGIDLMENFHAPYFSSSIGEFWTRWHISLNDWFKEYVYIPLGGNRKGFNRKIFNLFIVFLLSGLWHGASWNYVLWGVLNGAYRIIQEFMKKDVRQIKFDHEFLYKIRNTFKILFTYILVCFTWIFFRANTIKDSLYIIKNMFRNMHLYLFSQELTSIIKSSLLDVSLAVYFYCFVIVIGIVILLIVDAIRSSNKNNNKKLDDLLFSYNNKIIRWSCYVFMTVLIIFMFVVQNGIYGQTGQFIYFQF